MSLYPDFPTPDQLFPGLFEAVQKSDIFSDSKTFVDCTPKKKASEIMSAFSKSRGLTDFDLKTFVLDHFKLPEDYASGFEFDPDRNAQEHVKVLWPFLKRRGSEASMHDNSLIPIPNDYIVPGGRFGEIYYWDSYFTMLGLKVSGEEKLIEDMVANFAHMIETFGHIPNGNRTYFLSRSQPPFFVFMVDLLASIKGEEIMQEFLPHIEREYRFWMYGDRNIPRWGVNRYWDDNPIPRQESFLEDVELSVMSDRDATEVYRHLRAACESGWDFSSRWLGDGCTLTTVEAADIVPVDLNALMYGMESILMKTYQKLGRKRELNAIEMNRRRRKVFMDYHCWDKGTGMYYDYHVVKKERCEIESLATVYPLFTGMSNQEQADLIAAKIRSSFLKHGGLVTTTIDTGQQWDAPNGWAPLQWLAVQGLLNYGHKELALDIAERWTRLNEKVYRESGKFVEKYNVQDTGLEAGGGEYPVQDGFGWSNGVYLALKELLV